MEILASLASRIPESVTPNRLSWFRIWVIPILWGLYMIHPGLALLLYILACFTDWLDGHLARTRGLMTPEGKRLDEVSDKLLAVGVLGLLFADGTIMLNTLSPLFWYVAVIVFRECFITTLRQMWPERAKRIPSLWTAKVKTALMMAGFGLLILGGVAHPIYQELARFGVFLVFVSMVFALWSGARYYYFFTKLKE